MPAEFISCLIIEVRMLLAESIENLSLLVQDFKKKLLRQDVMCKGVIGRKLLWKMKGKRAGISRENCQTQCRSDPCERKEGRRIE